MSTYRVGVAVLENDVSKCYQKTMCLRPGAEIEILRLLFSMIGESYELVDIGDYGATVYDFGEQLPNGSFTGIIDLIYKGHLDMCGIAMRITRDRMNGALFTMPTRHVDTVLLVRQPTREVSRTFIFNAFPYYIWALMAACVFVAFIMNFIFRKFSCNLRPHLRPHTGNLLSGCIFKISFISMMCIMDELYQGDMYSYLASPNTLKLPFTTLTGAIAQVASQKNFFTQVEGQAFFIESGEKDYEAYRAAIRHNPVRKVIDESGMKASLDDGGIYGAVLDSAFMMSEYSIDRDGFVYIRVPDGKKQHLGYAVNKNLTRLRWKLDAAISRLVGAVPQLLTHHYDVQLRPFNLSYAPPLFPISLDKHLVQLEWFTSVLFGISILTFIAEQILWRMFPNVPISFKSIQELVLEKYRS